MKMHDKQLLFARHTGYSKICLVACIKCVTVLWKKNLRDSSLFLHFLGPSLNVILGPNGSGKSALVSFKNIIYLKGEAMGI